MAASRIGFSYSRIHNRYTNCDAVCSCCQYLARLMPQVRVPTGSQYSALKPALRACSGSDGCPRKRPNDPNPGLETCGRTTVQMTDAGSIPASFTTIKATTVLSWGFFSSDSDSFRVFARVLAETCGLRWSAIWPILGDFSLSPGHSSPRPRSPRMARSPQGAGLVPFEINGLRAVGSSNQTPPGASARIPEPGALVFPKRGRVDRQVKQRDVVGHGVVQDGGHDV